MNKQESFLNISILEDEGDSTAVITIDGQIGADPMEDEESQNTTSNMREKLKEIANLQVENIQVNINSLGGSVDDGLAIHDLLKENPATVTTKISGMSASSATIIFQAGDKRVISSNALMLIHRAWTMGMGNANNFEALHKDLKKTDDVIANIYAKRGGESKDFYMELMDENGGDGRWLDAEEAKVFALVDEVTEPQYKKVAMAGPSTFENLGLPVPNELRASQDEDIEQESTDEVVNQRSQEDVEENPQTVQRTNMKASKSRDRVIALFKFKKQTN